MKLSNTFDSLSICKEEEILIDPIKGSEIPTVPNELTDLKNSQIP